MTRARSLARLANENALSVSTDLNVGVNSTSPVEKLNVVGVVSATSFFGDGTSLSGVGNTDYIITGTAATFSGGINAAQSDVSVRNLTGVAATFTGVVTYEDVTNVDSVGFATFRKGINVQGAGSTTTTLNVTGVSTFGGNINLGDADKIRLGDSNDFDIYHGGSLDNHAYVVSNTGNLYLASSASGAVHLRGYNKDNLIVQSSSVQIYHNESLKFETASDGVQITGIASASTHVSSGIVTYYGDSSYSAAGRWVLGADGTNHYTFTGPGLGHSTLNDPTLYLMRGQTYMFENKMGAHPFRIQSTSNGSAGTQWNVGVTNNDVSNGVLIFEVPFVCPNTLYYQCTSHGNMGGVLNIVT